MTKPYRPSNGTEGDYFMADFCNKCAREAAYRRDPDANDCCDILVMTFAVGIDDPAYPKEWVTDDKGPRCTAFELEGSHHG